MKWLILACVVLATLVVAPAGAEETCPQVVAIAARGSDQNADKGEFVGPQRYGSRTSTGYEGRNLAGFFHYVDARHPGLMDEVYVLALDEQTYPAAMGLPPLAQEGEDLSPPMVAERLAHIVTTYSLPDLARRATVGAVESVWRGMHRAPEAVAEYERTSGCRPRYIAVGFSQGVVVNKGLERQIPLDGAVAIGNPLQPGTGMMSWLPLPGANIRRVSYCLDTDFVCRFNGDNAMRAAETKARDHASYFVQPRPQDEKIADTFAEWVRSG